jgi:hypothetical protein
MGKSIVRVATPRQATSCPFHYAMIKTDMPGYQTCSVSDLSVVPLTDKANEPTGLTISLKLPLNTGRGAGGQRAGFNWDPRRGVCAAWDAERSEYTTRGLLLTGASPTNPPFGVADCQVVSRASACGCALAIRRASQ